MVILINDECVQIPENITTPDAFCQWASASAFPRFGRFSLIRNEIWIDANRESIFLHHLLRQQIAAVLHLLARAGKLGYCFAIRAFLKNTIAGLATEPDSMFVSFATIEQGRVELVEGSNEELIIVDGAPDMVLEVVSRSSVRKDTIELFDLYWQAGIPEYWLVDARHEKARFDIFKRGPKGYRPTRKIGGWSKSAVFGKSFRIVKESDQLNNPQFTLEIKNGPDR